MVLGCHSMQTEGPGRPKARKKGSPRRAQGTYPHAPGLWKSTALFSREEAGTLQSNPRKPNGSVCVRQRYGSVTPARLHKHLLHLLNHTSRWLSLCLSSSFNLQHKVWQKRGSQHQAHEWVNSHFSLIIFISFIHFHSSPRQGWVLPIGHKCCWCQDSFPYGESDCWHKTQNHNHLQKKFKAQGLWQPNPPPMFVFQLNNIQSKS